MKLQDQHISDCAIALAVIIAERMSEEERKELPLEKIVSFVYETITESERLSLLVAFLGEYADTVGAEKAAELLAEPLRVYLRALSKETAFMS